MCRDIGGFWPPLKTFLTVEKELVNSKNQFAIILDLFAKYWRLSGTDRVK